MSRRDGVYTFRCARVNVDPLHLCSSEHLRGSQVQEVSEKSPKEIHERLLHTHVCTRCIVLLSQEWTLELDTFAVVELKIGRDLLDSRVSHRIVVDRLAHNLQIISIYPGFPHQSRSFFVLFCSPHLVIPVRVLK